MELIVIGKPSPHGFMPCRAGGGMSGTLSMCEDPGVSAFITREGALPDAMSSILYVIWTWSLFQW